MAKLLIFIAACSLRLPSVDTFKSIGWTPAFTATQDINITHSTVGILTHCSLLFDPLRETAPAIDATVRQLKSRSLPVLYLHDRYNPNNPAWNYLYSDWKPTAFVSSDVGHIDIDLSCVNHVVCLGGFYEQCERSTVSDVVRMWQRDGDDRDMRITQVTDGVFSVIVNVNSGDRYERRLRSRYRQKTATNRKAILTLAQVLDGIIDEELFTDFLKRQLYFMPSNVNVVMDVYGVIYPIQIVGEDIRTLTFAYRKSDRILDFKPPKIDFEKARRKPATAKPGSYPASSYPLASGTVIYSESGVPIEVYSTPTFSSPLPSGTTYPSGTVIRNETVYPTGTVFPGETVFPSGTVPSGSYTVPSSGIIYSNGSGR